MDLDKATAAVLVTRKNMEKEQAALVKAQGELQAAQQGLFVQKDAPFFQQKLMEMDLRIPQLQAELKEMLESIAAAEKEIEQEKGRVERMGQATASSPVTGVVWKRYGNPGQSVKQNETLYEIADSKTVFIEALLHQRFLNQIVPGCQATVNFTGGQTLTGKVRTVRTQMPSETEAAFAVNLADHDLKHVRVIIDFDPPVQDPSLIGRHCRVLIADERPTQVQQAVTWLFSNLRM
jgi:multidrug resistance efflux pump